MRKYKEIISDLLDGRKVGGRYITASEAEKLAEGILLCEEFQDRLTYDFKRGVTFGQQEAIEVVTDLPRIPLTGFHTGDNFSSTFNDGIDYSLKALTDELILGQDEEED